MLNFSVILDTKLTIFNYYYYYNGDFSFCSKYEPVEEIYKTYSDYTNYRKKLSIYNAVMEYNAKLVITDVVISAYDSQTFRTLLDQYDLCIGLNVNSENIEFIDYIKNSIQSYNEKFKLNTKVNFNNLQINHKSEIIDLSKRFENYTAINQNRFNRRMSNFFIKFPDFIYVQKLDEYKELCEFINSLNN